MTVVEDLGVPPMTQETTESGVALCATPQALRAAKKLDAEEGDDPGSPNRPKRSVVGDRFSIYSFGR